MVRLFASFLIMAGACATYLFGTYSKEIKSTLHYDQTTLNLLGFSKDLGADVGVFTGLIAEVTPTWFVLLLGATFNFGGYFMIWLAVTGGIPRPKVWQMCIYICIGANSQNFANTSALVTSVKNFPESRGSMLGWLPAAVSVIFVYTIRTMKPVRHPNKIKVFYKFLYASAVLAVFIMAITLAEKLVTFTKAAYASSTTVVCLLVFAPLFISIREETSLPWQKEVSAENQ